MDSNDSLSDDRSAVATAIAPETTSLFRRELGWIGKSILGLGLVATIVFAAISKTCGCSPKEIADRMRACSDARQIVITMQNYAEDHNRQYPSGRTSNEVFRELIKAGLLEDERCFTTEGSPYRGDNKIGEFPDYAAALLPGENHWCLTAGLMTNSNGDVPLIFENPVTVTWPPTWNADAYAMRIPGRAWREGRVVIGRNDGSVQAEQLESTTGKAVTLKRKADGKNLFEAAGPHEILDIER